MYAFIYVISVEYVSARHSALLLSILSLSRDRPLDLILIAGRARPRPFIIKINSNENNNYLNYMSHHEPLFSCVSGALVPRIGNCATRTLGTTPDRGAAGRRRRRRRRRRQVSRRGVGPYSSRRATFRKPQEIKLDRLAAAAAAVDCG